MLDILYQRRSIRKFKDTPIESEKVQQLMEAALTAPAAKNLHSTHYIVVDDKETLKKLSIAREMGSSFVEGSALTVVVLGDSNALEDVWIENAAIAATLIIVTAQSLGLATCWTQMRNRYHSENESAQNYLKQVLQLPDGIQALCMVAVGYADEQRRPHSKDRMAFDNVHYNQFGLKKNQ